MMMEEFNQLEQYFDDIRIPIRLACNTPSGWPVVVSLWFLYQDGFIYCATSKHAKVVSYLNNDPRCAFEIASDLPPYCGVRGQATAELDGVAGQMILQELLERYVGDVNNQFAQNLLSNAHDEVAIKIKPVNVFTWNFSERMQAIFPSMLKKVKKVCL
jgi:nitroimidazol reductase NimA-like FMN-containing flavoprotein (pyridoxamine 5'-phosphate oxidase superfamily)